MGRRGAEGRRDRRTEGFAGAERVAGQRLPRGRVVQSVVVEPLEWLREQGMVLQSARGPVPNVTEYVAGEPIRGSWWGHPAGHEIFAVLTHLMSSPDVVATRLINGKITLVHRRLWPAL